MCSIYGRVQGCAALDVWVVVAKTVVTPRCRAAGPHVEDSSQAISSLMLVVIAIFTAILTTVHIHAHSHIRITLLLVIVLIPMLILY